MSILIAALESLRPGASWELEGETYDGLTWLDEEQPKPTRTEVESVCSALEVELRSARVREQRRLAFVAESDPLFFKEQAGEVPEGTWQARREEVRERFPYPEPTEARRLPATKGPN